LLHGALQHLLEAPGDCEGHVDEPLDTVDDACLRLGVELVARLVDADVPAGVGEPVDLRLELCLLLLNGKELLQLGVRLVSSHWARRWDGRRK